jgi:hypothetical protein
MKIASLIARYLLGLMFAVFGLNWFLHFIPVTSPSTPLGVQFMTVLATSNVFTLVFTLELVAGLLLLANRYVPLALALLAPILVNILAYHALMEPGTIVPGIVATILWAVVFLSERAAFRGLFLAKTPAAV